MIAQSLNLIAQKLDDHLRSLWGLSDSTVIMARITNADGTIPSGNDNKIIVTLVNIEKESAISTYTPAQPVAKSSFTQISPPVYIDISVMFSANFTDYFTCLNSISETISFFQGTPWFTHESLPGLPPAIDKLTFELQDMGTEELSDLWSMHGGNYSPAVVYKVRLFPFSSQDPLLPTPPAPNN